MTTLTSAERAILTTRLTEAENAYHSIQTGGGVKTVVDQNGERVEYQTASLQRLSAYIADLKRQLGIGCATGPLNIWF